MTIRESALSIQLDTKARQRLEKAAHVVEQTPESFAEQAIDQRARDILLRWAVRRYREGDTTYSLLAEETGLGVVEIMYAMSDEGLEEALAAFLDHADTLAEERENPELSRLAQVIATQARETSRRFRD
jgi:hypothetical protein